jgi:O-antigen ligase
MSPLPAPAAGHALLDRLAPALALVGLVIALVAPRGTAAAFIGVALLPAAVLWFGGGLSRMRPLPLLMLVLVALGIYLAVNATWSASRGEAYGKVLFYWFALGLGYLAIAGTARLDDAALARLGRAVLVGVGIGALFLLVEVLSEQWIKRTVFNLLPGIRLDPKHVVVNQGKVTAIGPYVLNRSFAVLCLALWPALLIMRTRLAPSWRLPAVVALAVVTAAGVFRSEHETSMLALLFAAAAFAGMALLPRLMRPLIVAGWVVATVLVVPIAAASYAAGLQQATWIPETGRNRVVLWGVTAAKVIEAPLLGVGVAATRDLDEREKSTARTREGNTYPERTGRHSHNIFLQTWYELGAVGAALLLATGLLLLQAIARMPATAQPAAMASFVSAVLIGAFSWGMWQTWFMAAYGLWAVLLALAVEAERRRG